MVAENGATTIEVQVTYAGSRKGPWKQGYAPAVALFTVRTDAMTYFEVADSTDASGNQIVFRLMHGADTVTDLTKTVGAEAGDKAHLELRLVREVIAG